MRFIDKIQQPDSLADWKNQANNDWQPSWQALQSPEKSELHQALIDEQHNVCCYCEGEIEIDTSHIEHYRPKSKRPDLELEYFNLFASCGNPVKHEVMPKHCGNKKDNWYEEPPSVSIMIETVHYTK